MIRIFMLKMLTRFRGWLYTILFMNRISASEYTYPLMRVAFTHRFRNESKKWPRLNRSDLDETQLHKRTTR